MMAMMKKAVKARLLKYSPASDLELPPKPPKKKFQKPSPDDWKKLIEYSKSPFYFWRWFILTEYVTGARLGELLALKWEDIDISRDRTGQITGGTLHIQHALYSGMKKDGDKNLPLFIGGTKNSSHFDLKDIQAQLGHASIKITMDIYTHLDEESQQTKVGQWLEKDISELLNTSNELPLQNKS